MQWSVLACQSLASDDAPKLLPIPSALGLPQYADEHRSEGPVLLAVDQELGEGAGLRIAPELSGRRLPPEPISGATNSLDDITPELLSKVADVDLDHVGNGIAVVSPHLIEELGL